MFQSLIGQLQMQLRQHQGLHCNKFQSLIGQLQISYLYLKNCHHLYCFNPLQVSYKLSFHSSIFTFTFMFQSLIGQLQITKILNLKASLMCVSIPYRLATNTYLLQELQNKCSSFNPLQVSYKYLLPIHIKSMLESFNPLQVSYKL